MDLEVKRGPVFFHSKQHANRVRWANLKKEHKFIRNIELASAFVSLCNGKRRGFPTVCLHVSRVSYSVLPPQGRGSGFPGRRRPRGAGLSGRAGRGRARSKNGVNPSINPGVRTAERRLYSLHIVNGFCIFIPDWGMKASNFSKSQIFSVFFFLVFWRCADHNNRDTIPSQGRGGQRHAQHSGHLFQQWQFHIKTGAVLLYSNFENTRLRRWDFMCLTIYLGSASVFLFKTMQWENSRSMKDSKNWIQ